MLLDCMFPLLLVSKKTLITLQVTLPRYTSTGDRKEQQDLGNVLAKDTNQRGDDEIVITPTVVFIADR